MELREIEYFVTVAEERNFRRAAARMSMAQAPLSRAVAKLERDLGTRLLDRSSLPVSLTPAGEVFLHEAQVLLNQARRARRVTEQVGSTRGPLRVGFLGAAADGILPDAVRHFRQTPDAGGLRLLELESGLVAISRLRDEDVDLVLVRAAVVDPDLEFRVLFDEPYAAILPAEHTLAAGSPVSLGALADEPFIFWPHAAAPAPFEHAMRAFAELGFHPRVTQEALGVQAVLGLVAAGLGVSVLPSSVGSLHRDGVVTVPLAPPRPTIPLIAVWRREQASEAVERFVGALEAASASWTAGGSVGSIGSEG